MGGAERLSEYMHSTTKQRIHVSELVKIFGEDIDFRKIIQSFPDSQYFGYDTGTQWIIIGTEIFTQNRIRRQRQRFFRSLAIFIISIIFALMFFLPSLAILNILGFISLSTGSLLVVYDFSRLFQVTKEYEQIYHTGVVTYLTP